MDRRSQSRTRAVASAQEEETEAEAVKSSHPLVMGMAVEAGAGVAVASVWDAWQATATAEVGVTGCGKFSTRPACGQNSRYELCVVQTIPCPPKHTPIPCMNPAFFFCIQRFGIQTVCIFRWCGIQRAASALHAVLVLVVVVCFLPNVRASLAVHRRPPVLRPPVRPSQGDRRRGGEAAPRSDRAHGTGRAGGRGDRYNDMIPII